MVANGVPDVLAAARAQLKKGASQIKLAGGGGVISTSDPLDVTQYTPPELRAAVQAANDWGTYVASMLIRRMPFAKRSLQVLSLLSTDTGLMKRP